MLREFQETPTNKYKETQSQCQVECWEGISGNQTYQAKVLQASADKSLDAMSAESKFATSCKQMIVENTGQSRTSSTLVEILKILLDNTGD